MGILFVGCVPRVRTNLCSVTGKTGMGGKAVGRGAHRVRHTAPRGGFSAAHVL